MVRLLIARPLPEQVGHGSSTMSPRPRHVLQGSENAKLPRSLLRAPAAAEHAAEQVAKPPAGSRRPEQVAEIKAETTAARAAGWSAHPEAVSPKQRAGLVVLLAPLLVGQHVVRLGDLLEALFRFGVTLVGVGVELAGELAVRLLDLVGGSGLADAKDLVVVLFEEILRAHSLNYPFPAASATAILRRVRLIRSRFPFLARLVAHLAAAWLADGAAWLDWQPGAARR